MKSDYKTRAVRFLRMVYPYLEDKMTNPAACRIAMRQYAHAHSRSILVHFGVSRIAIITADYVIKFDYNPDKVRQVGGCQSEVEFYRFACKEGFEYLFAEITPVIYQGHIFYIMPRIRNIGRKECHYAEEFFEGEERYFLETFLYDLHDENYGWHGNTPIIFDYACNTLWLNRDQEVDSFRTIESGVS